MTTQPDVTRRAGFDLFQCMNPSIFDTIPAMLLVFFWENGYVFVRALFGSTQFFPCLCLKSPMSKQQRGFFVFAGKRFVT